MNSKRKDGSHIGKPKKSQVFDDLVTDTSFNLKS